MYSTGGWEQVASAKKVTSRPAAKKKAAPVKKFAPKTVKKVAKPVKKAAPKPAKKVVPAKKSVKKAIPVKKTVPKPTKKAVAKPIRKVAPKSVVKKPAPKPAKKVAPPKPVKVVAPPKPAKATVPPKPVKAVAPPKPVKAVAPPKPVKASAPAASVPEVPARLVMLPSAAKPKKKNGPPLKPLRNIPKPLVVSAGDDPWTKAELNAIKKDLQTDLDRLRIELASAEVEIADLLKDSGDGAGDDQADAGTKTFEREHELSLVNNSRDMVLQSERALARIELGTYGVCESCGNPIGKARLQVFPRATLCMVCKQREERR
jgi:DnaK suppressor protein